MRLKPLRFPPEPLPELWLNNDGSYVYAIRGTEQIVTDLLATDGFDIAIDGLAINQIVDTYND
ncbi:MAG: hypothetical protein LBU39_07040 [Desulfobulbaceae bacterium]|jgi:hypothetical protein|nr:hypothetical protein [Desulfobulbaceae bacterium]